MHAQVWRMSRRMWRMEAAEEDRVVVKDTDCGEEGELKEKLPEGGIKARRGNSSSHNWTLESSNGFRNRQAGC